jgi:hypothetical protein
MEFQEGTPQDSLAFGERNQSVYARSAGGKEQEGLNGVVGMVGRSNGCRP